MFVRLFERNVEFGIVLVSAGKSDMGGGEGCQKNRGNQCRKGVKEDLDMSKRERNRALDLECPGDGESSGQDRGPKTSGGPGAFDLRMGDFSADRFPLHPSEQD